MAKILIIDDDNFICKALQKQLQNKGYHAEVAFSGISGLKKLKQQPFDIVFCDFRLPDLDGLKILQQMRGLNIKTVFVIITAYADVKMAVSLMKQGAYDYLIKPLQPEEIINLIEKTITSEGEPNKENFSANNFVAGTNAAYNSAIAFAKKVAPTNMSVLIEGETGTGKEYFARFIHDQSKRKSKPFLAVDCGAVPKELANSELFGHVKGSFTGAISNKTGVFEQASGGTLFLDEIGNLSYSIQIQLLRVLQEKVVTRVGDNKPVKVDVRIIAATNEPLDHLQTDFNFREDLLHRIKEFKILLPPLRNRKEDILLLANRFIELANIELGTQVKGFSKQVVTIFENYEWPGNIRELKNVVKRSVLLSIGDIVQPENLPVEIVKSFKISEFYDKSKSIKHESNLKIASSETEKQILINSIIDAGYNKSKAARNLKIDRKTLYNKIKQYGIDI